MVCVHTNYQNIHTQKWTNLKEIMKEKASNSRLSLFIEGKARRIKGNNWKSTLTETNKKLPFCLIWVSTQILFPFLQSSQYENNIMA